MEAGGTTEPCAFEKLFTRNVPHILEKIYFSLDYRSFKSALRVNKTWNETLSTEPYLTWRKRMMIENKHFCKTKKNVGHFAYYLDFLYSSANNELVEKTFQISQNFPVSIADTLHHRLRWPFGDSEM